MLSASRALRLNAHTSPPLPQPPELAPLWEWGGGITPRQGELIMIAGRPGSQKSGFALFWVAQMGLPALYFAADMTPYEATTRLAAMKTRESSQSIGQRIEAGGTDRYVDALNDSKITFAFGSPILWHDIEDNINAWVEMYNEFPPVIVFDNLMDFAGAEADYQMQMQVMQDLTSLSRTTGSTVIVLHHAKDIDGHDSGLPPNSSQIKNRLGEKPQLTLTVALATQVGCELRVAVVKNRNGSADPGALSYIRLKAMPEYTRFEPGPSEWYGPRY